MRPAAARIIDLAAALAWRADLRRCQVGTLFSATLVVTNGCYDVLHAGHVASLASARAEGDALLVLLNSDVSVRALKGAGRPVFSQAARALLLAALRSVDAVVIFEGLDCAAELRALAPEVYVKSDEYRDRQNAAEKAALEACGAQIVWLPRDGRYSTTAALESMEGGALPRTPPRERAPSDSPELVAAAGTAEYCQAAAAPVAGACGLSGKAEPSGPQDMPRGGDWGVP